jgi:hypothetical protein
MRIADELERLCVKEDRRHKHEWVRHREWVRVRATTLRDAATMIRQLEAARSAEAQLNTVLVEQLELYKRLSTQRGARMQIMREFLEDKKYQWESFVRIRPEAKKWFDEDGVPCR